MKKFTPYEKLSKKLQREIDRQRRGDWGDINPVTRRPERSDAYNRKKETRRWQDGADGGSYFISA